jgi:hypothetical protein
MPEYIPPLFPWVYCMQPNERSKGLRPFVSGRSWVRLLHFLALFVLRKKMIIIIKFQVLRCQIDRTGKAIGLFAGL